MMRIVFTAVILILSLFCDAVELIPIDHPEVIHVAQTDLEAVGTLQQTDQGFVYLAVDDAYIYRLFPLIKAEGYELQMPPQDMAFHITLAIGASQ